MRLNSRTSFIVGERYVSKYGDEYEITGYSKNSRERRIKFSDGYEDYVTTGALRKNAFRSPNRITYYGVGCLGFWGGTTHLLYWRWFNMIGRCYDQKHTQYKSYGAKGVRVERFLRNFKNYCNFISGLKHYDELVCDPNGWQIDKDVKGGGVYSCETISIIPSSENLDYENAKKRVGVAALDRDGSKLIFPSISAAALETGIEKRNISLCVWGRRGTAGGYRWCSVE